MWHSFSPYLYGHKPTPAPSPGLKIHAKKPTPTRHNHSYNSHLWVMFLVYICTTPHPTPHQTQQQHPNNKTPSQLQLALTCMWRSSGVSAPVTFSAGGPFFPLLCGGLRKGRWASPERCTLIDTLLGVWRRSVTASKWLSPVMSWPFTCTQSNA